MLTIFALIYLCSRENLLQKRRGDRNKDNLVPLSALPPNIIFHKNKKILIIQQIN